MFKKKRPAEITQLEKATKKYLKEAEKQCQLIDAIHQKVLKGI